MNGNPPDDQPFKVSLAHHQQLFAHLPDLVSTDRGVYSPDNEQAARQAGVKHICMPQPGHRTPQRHDLEQQKWFRLGRRFQAGVEGHISVVALSRLKFRVLQWK